MQSTVFDHKAIQKTLEVLASAIIERHGSCASLLLVGIQRRGVTLAKRLNTLIAKQLGKPLLFGTLDINLYRDDWTSLESSPVIGPSAIPDPVEGKTIILVDDVLFTGRTIRAALEAILDYGRPQRVELLVLVDRGHRELPIHADYIGHTIPTEARDHVDVFLEESDGHDAIALTRTTSAVAKR